MHFGRLLKYRNHVDDMIMKCVYVPILFLLKKKKKFQCQTQTHSFSMPEDI